MCLYVCPLQYRIQLVRTSRNVLVQNVILNIGTLKGQHSRKSRNRTDKLPRGVASTVWRRSFVTRLTYLYELLILKAE